MAEGKKSFVLYADLIHTVMKMPMDKRGELLTIILEYVNDLDPKTDDMIVDLVFEPIKRQLKRDLDKWSGEKEDRSINGRMGNLKRWNKDLYDKVILEELNLNEAETIAKDRKASPPDPIRSTTIANVAVNDTVTVTVNDTVNDIKEKKKKPTPIKLKGEFENIPFTEKSYRELREKYGKDAFHWMIKKLSAYAKQENKKVKDPAAYFSNWVYDAYLEKHPKQKEIVTNQKFIARGKMSAEEIEEAKEFKQAVERQKMDIEAKKRLNKEASRVKGPLASMGDEIAKKAGLKDK
jgi:hypothetical protein